MDVQNVQLVALPMQAVQFGWQGLHILSVGSTKELPAQWMQLFVAGSTALPGKQEVQFETEPAQVRHAAEQGRHSLPTRTVPLSQDPQRSRP